MTTGRTAELGTDRGNHGLHDAPRAEMQAGEGGISVICWCSATIAPFV